jgi:hypothetical protein
MRASPLAAGGKRLMLDIAYKDRLRSQGRRPAYWLERAEEACPSPEQLADAAAEDA